MKQHPPAARPGAERRSPRRHVALRALCLLGLTAVPVAGWQWITLRDTAVASQPTQKLPLRSTPGSDALRKAGLPPNGQGREVNGLVRQPAARPKQEPQIPARARWAMGKTIDSVPVRREDKVFALTFDDGPWPQYTREVLKVLRSRNVKATFFMVGQEVARRPELAREVRAAGHAVGSHSWGHPSRPRSPVSEVKKTDQAILRATGVKSTLFRPPYGLVKNGMAAEAMRQKQSVIMWTADSGDWKRGGARSIANRVLRQASPGGIALLHDGGGHRAQTVAALPIIIDGLKARGYRFVTVPQLLELRHQPPAKPRAVAKSGSRAKSTTKSSAATGSQARARKAAAATKARSHLSKR